MTTKSDILDILAKAQADQVAANAAQDAQLSAKHQDDMKALQDSQVQAITALQQTQQAELASIQEGRAPELAKIADAIKLVTNAIPDGATTNATA